MTGVFFLLFLGTTSFNSPIQYGRVQLDDGWTISRDGMSWQVANLQNSNIDVTNKGDVITISRTMPMSSIFPATISFRTVLATVEVYLEDELIYSFGEDYVSTGRMLPKVEHFVQLPDDYPEKQLKIVLTATEKEAFAGLTPVYFGNYNDIKNYLVQSTRFSLIIGVYLCHLGFMLLILSPFLAFADYHDYSIFFSALTSLTLGVYILCYCSIFWYLSDNAAFYTFVEYYTMFMMPAIIVGFVITADNTNFRILGTILFGLNLLFALITGVLHLTNTVHICAIVPFFHIIAVAEGIFIIASLSITAFKESHQGGAFRSHSTSTNMLILGLILFLVCAVIDIIKYNVLKFSRIGEVNSNFSFMTIGALIFIMCLLLNYFYHCIEYTNESTIKVQLEGIAYTDALTGLSNRARCEQVLAGIRGEYTIISLDLDYLKYTNDNYGHDKGDLLLSGFSEILKKSFSDATLVGRMGGDEFIVILPFVDTERTDRDLRGFADLLSYRNSTESGLRFSASWGYATSRDSKLSGDVKAQNVYLLADTRMYEMKTKHHKQSLGRLYDDLLNKLTEDGDKHS
jgi:diguanylate cyclase (GGDEF)-like protein